LPSRRVPRRSKKPIVVSRKRSCFSSRARLFLYVATFFPLARTHGQARSLRRYMGRIEHSNGRPKRLSSKRQERYLTIRRAHVTLAPQAPLPDATDPMPANAKGHFLHQKHHTWRRIPQVGALFHLSTSTGPVFREQKVKTRCLKVQLSGKQLRAMQLKLPAAGGYE
jgi:hypothetical protein